MAKLLSSYQVAMELADQPSTLTRARTLFAATYRPGENVDSYVARLVACHGEANPVILANCRRLANDAAWRMMGAESR